MSNVSKSHRARADLLEIWTFVAADNDVAADALLDRIEVKLAAIAEYPHIGSPRSDLSPDVRSAVVGRYILLYRPVRDGIELVRVLHGARDIKGTFRG